MVVCLFVSFSYSSAPECRELIGYHETIITYILILVRISQQQLQGVGEEPEKNKTMSIKSLDQLQIICRSTSSFFSSSSTNDRRDREERDIFFFSVVVYSALFLLGKSEL